MTLTERVVTKEKIKKVFTLKSYELEGRSLACWLQSSCSCALLLSQLRWLHCDTPLLRLTDNPWVFDGFNFKAAGGGFWFSTQSFNRSVVPSAAFLHRSECRHQILQMNLKCSAGWFFVRTSPQILDSHPCYAQWHRPINETTLGCPEPARSLSAAPSFTHKDTRKLVNSMWIWTFLARYFFWYYKENIIRRQRMDETKVDVDTIRIKEEELRRRILFLLLNASKCI